MDDNTLEPIGTKKAEYAGPQFAPFRCGHCRWFNITLQGCGHKVVVSDPEIPHVKAGVNEPYAQVNANGCCRFFRSKGK